MKLFTKSLYITSGFLLLAFSGYSQSHSKGLDFDDQGYDVVPKKAKLTRSLDVVPTSASIKMYAPTPKDQGDHGTCAAWATGYCGVTILEAIQNGLTTKEEITRRAFSPAFLFRLLKPNDAKCEGGSSLVSALQLLKDRGNMLYQQVSEKCIPSVTSEQLNLASKNKINAFMKVFGGEATNDIKIQAVKKSLAEKKPVVIGMVCPPSFNNAKNVWKPTEQPNRNFGGHAMCVVGYDDNKDGGSFEVQNSWGTNWGNAGYIWINYKTFANFTSYAFELIDLPTPKPEVADLSGRLKLVLETGGEMPSNLFISTRGLSVVPAKTIPGPLTLYQTANSYTSGTRFRIYISNNEPAFVYAISTDLSQQVTKIFPYEEGISAALTDRKNDVAIPDEDHFIQFDNKPGKDFLCVLYSKTELNINDIVQKIENEKGTFSEKIFKVIGDKIVDPKNIQFSKDNISFKGFSRGKSIIPLMVEMDHK